MLDGPFQPGDILVSEYHAIRFTTRGMWRDVGFNGVVLRCLCGTGTHLVHTETDGWALDRFHLASAAELDELALERVCADAPEEALTDG